MALYLLHIEPRYQHAGHYLGYTKRDVRTRVGEHMSRSPRCSPLVRAALGQGSAVALVRVWPNGSRTDERRLKRGGGLSRHCPVCRLLGTYHR